MEELEQKTHDTMLHSIDRFVNMDEQEVVSRYGKYKEKGFLYIARDFMQMSDFMNEVADNVEVAAMQNHLVIRPAFERHINTLQLHLSTNRERLWYNKRFRY